MNQVIERADCRSVPKPAPASRQSRLAPRPFMPTKAGLEPRPPFPSENPFMYASNEGLR